MKKGVITSTTKYKVNYWYSKEKYLPVEREFFTFCDVFSHVYDSDTEDIAYNLAEEMRKKLFNNHLYTKVSSLDSSTFYEKKNGDLIITNDYRTGGSIKGISRIRCTYLIKAL